MTTSGQIFLNSFEAERVEQKYELETYLTLNWSLCTDCIDTIVNNIDELIEKLIELKYVDAKSEES